MPRFVIVAVAVAACLGACGTPPETVALPPDAVPVAVGPGPAFRPGLRNVRAWARSPIAGMRCRRAGGARVGVFVELLAHGRLILLPAGIGMAAPLRRHGPYVLAGRCSYPLRTREPTGLVEVDPRTRATLGQLFALWGQPLGERMLALMRGPVRTYVDGRRRGGDPRAVPLRRHAVIVLEIGRRIPPHARYAFPAGL